MKILLLVLILERFDRKMKKSLSIAFSIACLMGPAALADEKALEIFEHYCFDCHGDGSDKGGLDLSGMLVKEDFDGSLIFENLVTGKMPPADKDQPDAKEKRELLEWLAGRQGKHIEKSFRRISRHEFVHSVNRSRFATPGIHFPPPAPGFRWGRGGDHGRRLAKHSRAQG